MRKTSLPTFVMFLVLASALLLSGCNMLPAFGGAVPGDPPQTQEPAAPLPSPVFAREAALAFICSQHPQAAPALDLTWSETQVDAQGLVGSTTFQYTAGDWSLRVSYPIVAPEATIYSVRLTNVAAGIGWDGTVDAVGRVSELAFVVTDLTPPATAEPEPEPDPRPVVLTYQDPAYLLSLQYPQSWTLTTSSVGQPVATGYPASRLLEFRSDGWVLRIHYKFLTDSTGLGGGLPAGEISDRGWIVLLGRALPQHVLVYEGKDKLVYFGDRFTNLEFYIRLEADLSSGQDYGSVQLPAEILAEAKAIAESIVQTGQVATPPAPTPTQAPTATPAPTPTPVPLPCYAAKFISDISVPDGSVFYPDADFTKTWQLKNVGSCTWNTNYDLIYVEGDRMSAARVIDLPASVAPGATIDLSVGLIAPQETGSYRGYWMLRAADGTVFGIGDRADKAFWVDIKVVKAQDNYIYDFATLFCDADWRSGEGRLNCSNAVAADGRVALLNSPALENRREDELALWVHPNEAEYGWIEGVYPRYTVQKGDHFMAWVGCLEGNQKCNLTFLLEYQDANGAIHILGEWDEVYDGQVHEIDLDLSSLAGQNVRFILRTELNGTSYSAAQGFWFVPRIERPATTSLVPERLPVQ